MEQMTTVEHKEDPLKNDGGGDRKQPNVHVEIVQRNESLLPRERLCEAAEAFVAHKVSFVDGFLRVAAFNEEHPILRDHALSLDICYDEGVGGVHLNQCHVRYHIFKLDRNGRQAEDMEEEEQVHAANHWLLPSEDFHGQWETLIYIKLSLLTYVETTLVFSAADVDPNLVCWNRVVLLHGPPGTGKTSLCRALAHKLAVRMSDRYKYGMLVEINSHSLFSKWFSESGKLVQRMFETIQELVNDPEALVCVLIDEVESLAAARKSSGNEPSDAIRVVNAVLTQIDNIKRCPNVLILTTSNITGSIDLAFVDRADIKKFIGLPSEEAIYQMLMGSLGELIKKNLVEGSYLLSKSKLQKMMSPGKEEEPFLRDSVQLIQVSRRCIGFSGRTIRKLPFLAFAKLMQQNSSKISVKDMLSALEEVALEQHSDMQSIGE